jgi:indolepyruvate ferredoxin oxidoreductase, alpha subunit
VAVVPEAVPIRDPLLASEVGASECLLGNEAIVRAALEAGVGYATGYPGTPSSEVTDGFARIAGKRGIVFEYAVNEKIAVELAFAASLAGTRSICAMKHLGLMVAGDPLSTIPYVGVVGGMVIVSAGDPSCRTSPNEQDQRHLGPMLHLPVLDPSTPAEAHAMTLAAFELSEHCHLPVLLRTTTRVAHSRETVAFGPLSEPRVKGFVRDPSRWVPVPANARRMRLELGERVELARTWLAGSGFFRRQGEGSTVVLASGAPAATAADVIAELGVGDRVALWSLGIAYPLPEAELVEALRSVERVLVVEELSPYLENALWSLTARHGLRLQILGKQTGHLPEEFEYTPRIIQRGLHSALGLGADPGPEPKPLPVAPRPPSLCPGCPHRAAFFAARAAFGEDQLFFNDIGCYTLGYGPPLGTADALLCMGAGFSLAAGVSRVTGKRTVGFLGDSTFFHAGMPALLGAIKENVNMVAVILDNQVTAMTGFQQAPVPSDTPLIEGVARALGARHVESIDPYDVPASIAAFERARDAEGTAVVVVRRACPVHMARSGAPRPTERVEIDSTTCRSCGREELGLRCKQSTTELFERNLARVAATRERCEPAPEVAPCATRCPLSLCIQGYAGHIAEGEYAEALGHVLERTVLPESVCRVCDRPCEDTCVRSELDAAVAINDLKRFVVDWAVRERPELLSVEVARENGKSVAVVGAGPSGLSAALELRQRGYAVTLLDAHERPGGLLSHGIPVYRLPRASVERDVARVLEAGVRFRGGVRLGRDVALSALLAEHDAVFLALGAGRPKRLELDGLEHVTTTTALEFLAAELDTAGRVVVIGGGNAAVDAARTALRRGASEVALACVEQRQAMPALRDEVTAAEHEGVAMYFGVRPARVEPGALIVCSIANREERRIAADQIVFAVGQAPDIDGAFGDLDLEHASDGTLVVDRATGATRHPRVFAGGDLVPGPRTVTAAMAAGLRAAWGIDCALRGEAIAARRAPPALPESWPVAHVHMFAPVEPRHAPPELAGTERSRSFEEVVGVLSEADARAEAMRCLMCGLCGNCRACVDTQGCPALVVAGAKVDIDRSLCTSCGVCISACSNGAIVTRSPT